ncbi:FGGY-family carbohydrate kinase [Treponema sp.]|uniref:xylulokinase n=1 Tax=Treponema sp. TaxID=166 RepID=UPI0038903D43
MTKYNFLCIDIGTSSLKAALVSDKGQVLSFYRETFSALNKSKISSDWIAGLQNSIYKIKRDFKIGKEDFSCDAVCISGNGPTLVCEDGTTLLWNEKIDDMKNVVKAGDSAGTTSGVTNAGTATSADINEKFSHSLFIPRIKYLKQKHPESFDDKKIFSGPEYLIWYLTGTHITILPEERYEAAYWNDDAIKHLGAKPEQFGRFVSPGFNCGKLTEEASSLFGLDKNIPVIAGGPDFIVAMIGTNTLKPGRLCDCAGSSEGINLCTDKQVFAEGIRTLPSVMSGLWNVAVLMQSSGRQFVECKENYEYETNQKISYAEYINTCFKNQKSSGFIIMTNLAHSVKDALEKITDCAKKNNLKIDDVMMITGGQSKSPEWIQHKADIINYKICTTEVADSELIGDAVLASVALALHKSITDAADEMVKKGRVYAPRSTGRL